MSSSKPMKGNMDKGGDYGLKKGGAKTGYSSGYNPKQCPPKANLGVRPTSKRG